MEFAALLTAFLSPFLPHLLKLGEPIAEAAGKKLGEQIGQDSWATAKAAWAKVQPKVEDNPIAISGAKAIAQDRQSKKAQTLLTQELTELLEANPELAQSLKALLKEDDPAVQNAVQVTQNVTGDMNITIGSASGSVNIQQG